MVIDPQPIGDSLADEDSTQYMSALGWLKGLREDTEIMPNTRGRRQSHSEKDKYGGGGVMEDGVSRGDDAGDGGGDSDDDDI